MSTPKPQIFLSYSHSDLETVRRLYEEFKARELNVWFDKVDIGLGKWKPKTTRAIMRSRYFIFCISEVALSRINADPPSFQDEELTYALEIALNQDPNKFSIIPVRLDDCDRGDHRLSVWNQFNLFNSWDSTIDRLAIKMGGISLADRSQTDQRTDFEKKISDRLNRAEALYYSEEYKKGEKLLEAIIEFEDKPSVRSHTLMGNMLWGQNRPRNALEWLEKALSLDVKNGRYSEALQTYEDVIKIDQTFSYAWYNKGLVLRYLGRYEEALQAAECALEIDSEYIDAWLLKANALYEVGYEEEAFQAYGKVVKLSSARDGSNSYIIGNALCGLGQYEEALNVFNNALKINSLDVKLLHGKAVCLWKTERSEEALRVFEDILKVDVNNIYAWNGKGLILENLQQYEEALIAYESGLEINSKFTGIWMLKGKLLHNLNRPEEALQALNSSLEIDSKFVRAWYIKANVLSEMGRKRKALEAYEKVLEIKPTHAGAWKKKGHVLKKLGQIEEAQIAFAEAKRLEEVQNESKP